MPANPPATPPASSTAIVVLGMHRSGTSVFSRALIALGVDFGGTFVDAAVDNPKGFFEDKDVNALNVSFLSEMGYRWYTLLLPNDVLLTGDPKFKGKASALLQEKFAKKRLWGLKEPRITRLLPLWCDAIADIGALQRFVLANRNPLSVADSLAKRDGIPRNHALGLWALHQIDGLDAIVNNGGIVVDYDLMMDQPSTELLRLARFLEQEIDIEKQNTFLDDFLQRDLRHTCHNQSSDVGSPLADSCMAFHKHLRTLAQTEGALTNNDLATARNVLSEARASMAEHYEWFLAIDSGYIKMERVRQELRESLARELSLRSQIHSVESKTTVKIFNSIKQALSRK